MLGCECAYSIVAFSCRDPNSLVLRRLWLNRRHHNCSKKQAASGGFSVCSSILVVSNGFSTIVCAAAEAKLMRRKAKVAVVQFVMLTLGFATFFMRSGNNQLLVQEIAAQALGCWLVGRCESEDDVGLGSHHQTCDLHSCKPNKREKAPRRDRRYRIERSFYIPKL